MKPDVKILKGIYGADRIIYENISPDYSHDELGGGLVTGSRSLFFRSPEEVAQTMKYAMPTISVVARVGTGPAHRSPSCGITLDFTRMNSFIELDNENLTVTVHWVCCLWICRNLLRITIFLSSRPGRKSATIGGNISTNAGGMRAEVRRDL